MASEQYPQRKATRLSDYDYSSPGAYFITICTQGKRCILSRIVSVGEGLAPPVTELTALGQITQRQILDLESRFPSATIDRYVIMPNHLHLLITLHPTLRSGGASPSPTVTAERSGGASPSPTVTEVVCTLKSLTSRLARDVGETPPIWQRSFHDHVIRNERDYREIWEYIENNPARWAEDCYAP